MPLAVEHETAASTAPSGLRPALAAARGLRWLASAGAGLCAAFRRPVASLGFRPVNAAGGRFAPLPIIANNPVLIPNQNRDLVFETVRRRDRRLFQDRTRDTGPAGRGRAGRRPDRYLSPQRLDDAGALGTRRRQFLRAGRGDAAVDPPPGDGSHHSGRRGLSGRRGQSSRNWKTCCGPKPARPAGQPICATTIRSAANRSGYGHAADDRLDRHWAATWPWNRRFSSKSHRGSDRLRPLPPRGMPLRAACRRQA